MIERVLDMLFILHADHEQNCSTSTVRMVGSSHADLFTSIAAGVGALSGPLHGGANVAVLEMLKGIQADGGDVKAFVGRVKDKEPGVKLMGFGHRVYKNYDPRAAIVKQATGDVLAAARQGRPAARPRDRARADRARRRLLHRAQALPERRFLQRRDLQGDGLPDPDVHRAVRDRPAARLDRALARDDARSRLADRPAAPGLHRSDRPRLPADGAARLSRSAGSLRRRSPRSRSRDEPRSSAAAAAGR